MPTTDKRQSSSREQLLQLYRLYAENLRYEGQLYRHQVWAFFAIQALIGYLALHSLGPESWAIGLLDPPKDREHQVRLLGFAMLSLTGLAHALLTYSQLLRVQMSRDHLCELWNSKYWTLAHSFGLPDLCDSPCSDRTDPSQAKASPSPRLPFVGILVWISLAAISLTQLALGIMFWA